MECKRKVTRFTLTVNRARWVQLPYCEGHFQAQLQWAIAAKDNDIVDLDAKAEALKK